MPRTMSHLVRASDPERGDAHALAKPLQLRLALRHQPRVDRLVEGHIEVQLARLCLTPEPLETAADLGVQRIKTIVPSRRTHVLEPEIQYILGFCICGSHPAHSFAAIWAFR